MLTKNKKNKNQFSKPNDETTPTPQKQCIFRKPSKKLILMTMYSSRLIYQYTFINANEPINNYVRL